MRPSFIEHWKRRFLFREIKRRVSRSSQRIRSCDGVTALGAGQKVRRSKSTGHLAIVAYVVKKVPNKQVGQVPRIVRSHLLGRSIRVRTDVEEGGGIGQTTSLASGSLIYAGAPNQNFYPGSCSCAKSSGGSRRLVTCAHTFFNPTDPDHAPPCCSSNLKNVGTVATWTQLSEVGVMTGDAARVDLQSGVVISSMGVEGGSELITTISHIDPIKSDYFYVTQGVATGLGPGRYRDQSNVIVLNHRGVNLRYARCWLMAPSSAVVPGQSGSLVVRRTTSGLEAAGILFGTYAGFATVFDADRMFARVGF
jgi:hypothetical protein